MGNPRDSEILPAVERRGGNVNRATEGRKEMRGVRIVAEALAPLCIHSRSWWERTLVALCVYDASYRDSASELSHQIFQVRRCGVTSKDPSTL